MIETIWADGIFCIWINDLSLSYDGNQLKVANDNAINSVYGNGFESKDGSKQDMEYFHNRNENLIQGLNRKIIDIQYNYLNSPNSDNRDWKEVFAN